MPKTGQLTLTLHPEENRGKQSGSKEEAQTKTGKAERHKQRQKDENSKKKRWKETPSQRRSWSVCHDHFSELMDWENVIILLILNPQILISQCLNVIKQLLKTL